MADGGARERLLVGCMMAVIFLVLGALFGRWLRSWTAGLYLAAPGVLVALLLGDQWQLSGLAILALLVSSLVGSWVGSRLRF